MSVLMFDGVTIDRRVMGGVPCIANTHIPVAAVVAQLGRGSGISDLLTDYPDLTKEGILAGLRYAARVVNERC